MALSKNPNTYPQQFFLLAEKLEKTPIVTVTNLQRPTAENLRFQFHGFRKALQAAGQISRFPTIETVVVSLKKNESETFDVTFLHKEQTDFASALNSVLDSAISEIPKPSISPESEPPSQLDVLSDFLGTKS